MGSFQHIADQITALLPAEGGVVVIRSAELATSIQRPGPTLLLCTAAQAKKAAAKFPALQPMVDEGLLPQLAPGSASALVAVECLADEGDRTALVRAWVELLGPGGRLLLVERVKQGAVARGLRRLGGGAKVPPLTPEVMCAALLNAGLRQVGQAWPAGRPARVITFGTRI